MRVKEFIQNTSQPLEIQDGYSEHFYSRNGSMQVLLYTVPKLDYTNEDIKIEFSLTIKGGNASLILAAALCK